MSTQIAKQMRHLAMHIRSVFEVASRRNALSDAEVEGRGLMKKISGLHGDRQLIYYFYERQ